jgi:hypothetical protein
VITFLNEVKLIPPELYSIRGSGNPAALHSFMILIVPRPQASTKPPLKKALATF